MQSPFIKSDSETSQLWWFHGLMVELRHSVIIQMNEPMSTFCHKSLNIDTKQELFRYLTIVLTGNQRNMWDMDLAKLFHLTDPE